MYNQICKQINDDKSITYSFASDKKEAQMRIYSLFTGIRLIHHDVYHHEGYLGTVKKGNILEIHHCKSGCLKKTSEENCFCMNPGDIAISRVNRETTPYDFPLNYYEGITISINLDIAPKCLSYILKDINIKPDDIVHKLCDDSVFLLIKKNEVLENIFEELYHVNKIGYYKLKVLELLFVLNETDIQVDTSNRQSLSSLQVELAKKINQYIKDHIHVELSVDMLSEYFHVSKTHLQNAFKGVYGVPVMSYVRHYRMNCAALELIDTQDTIIDIANRWGYDNASQFASAFKAEMNETPLKYRKKYRTIKV